MKKKKNHTQTVGFIIYTCSQRHSADFLKTASNYFKYFLINLWLSELNARQFR